MFDVGIVLGVSEHCLGVVDRMWLDLSAIRLSGSRPGVGGAAPKHAELLVTWTALAAPVGPIAKLVTIKHVGM